LKHYRSPKAFNFLFHIRQKLPNKADLMKRMIFNGTRRAQKGLAIRTKRIDLLMGMT